MYIPGYSLVTNFFPGQILVWFLTIFWRFTHFKINMTISRKNMPLHVFIFESWWICPGISALFPGISAFFPGISAQKNRHIFTQSRVRSAQKARNPKLTTIIKKWPFPAPSQEIRPKGRNLGNGHLFVSFRRSRYAQHVKSQSFRCEPSKLTIAPIIRIVFVGVWIRQLSVRSCKTTSGA